MLATLKDANGERAARRSATARRPPTSHAGSLRAQPGSPSRDWLQQRLWNRLGMEHDGNVMLDPVGTEVAFAGMSASLRDLGRIGQMLLQRGRVGGSRSSRPASSTS
jgi:CubicO group peptidase (beta-lactamase class C family)